MILSELLIIFVNKVLITQAASDFIPVKLKVLPQIQLYSKMQSL